MGQAPVYPEDGDRGVAGGVDQGDEGGDDVPTYGGGGDGGVEEEIYDDAEKSQIQKEGFL